MLRICARHMRDVPGTEAAIVCLRVLISLRNSTIEATETESFSSRVPRAPHEGRPHIANTPHACVRTLRSVVPEGVVGGRRPSLRRQASSREASVAAGTSDRRRILISLMMGV